MWAEKEYFNLHKLRRANVPAPLPIRRKHHVLLMTLIGDEDGKPAPKLKSVDWGTDEQKADAFQQVKKACFCFVFIGLDQHSLVCRLSFNCSKSADLCMLT